MDMLKYEHLGAGLDELDAYLDELEVTVSLTSEWAKQVAVFRTFLADFLSKDPERLEQWVGNDSFARFHDSLIASARVCEAVLPLRGHDRKIMHDNLQIIVDGNVSQTFEEEAARNYLYELEVASWLVRTGYTVALGEPDIRVSNNGLNQEYGIACKFVSSEKKLNSNISKGYEQIEGQKLTGLVAVGMDNLVFQNLGGRYIKFPSDQREIFGTLRTNLHDRVRKLEAQRAGTPGRLPLDGALFTLSIAGIYGEPSGLTFVHDLHFQSKPDNPIFPDLLRLQESFRSLNG